MLVLVDHTPRGDERRSTLLNQLRKGSFAPTRTWSWLGHNRRATPGWGGASVGRSRCRHQRTPSSTATSHQVRRGGGEGRRIRLTIWGSVASPDWLDGGSVSSSSDVEEAGDSTDNEDVSHYKRKPADTILQLWYNSIDCDHWVVRAPARHFVVTVSGSPDRPS